MLTDGEIGVVSPRYGNHCLDPFNRRSRRGPPETVRLDLWGQVLIGVLIAIVVGYAGSTSI
jgi:hypothetical protein